MFNSRLIASHSVSKDYSLLANVNTYMWMRERERERTATEIRAWWERPRNAAGMPPLTHHSIMATRVYHNGHTLHNPQRHLRSCHSSCCNMRLVSKRFAISIDPSDFGMISRQKFRFYPTEVAFWQSACAKWMRVWLLDGSTRYTIHHGNGRFVDKRYSDKPR